MVFQIPLEKEAFSSTPFGGTFATAILAIPANVIELFFIEIS